MTGKSRRKRGKQSPSRKARSQQRPPAASRVPAAPASSEVTTQPEAISPPTTAARQPVKSETIQFSYIATELRTIGILAGIMLIVLIILYFTLV
ncbi:MAG TPA: hypothetical protein G4O18_06910 [Dehalococcoidia bacterium]|nr:hypothetical protein [Dehalococcoidia bacterium]